MPVPTSTVITILESTAFYFIPYGVDSDALHREVLAAGAHQAQLRTCENGAYLFLPRHSR